MTNPQITIYSTATCSYCQAEKAFLKGHGKAFEEVRVDIDEAAAEAMIARSGQMGVPFTVVTDDKGAVIDEFVGFDQARLSKAVGL